MHLPLQDEMSISTEPTTFYMSFCSIRQKHNILYVSFCILYKVNAIHYSVTQKKSTNHGFFCHYNLGVKDLRSLDLRLAQFILLCVSQYRRQGATFNRSDEESYFSLIGHHQR
jgi:hypothetical protein